MNKKTIIALGISVAVLAAGVITLGVLFGKSSKDAKNSRAMLEAHYQQAYYTLLDETDDMEIKFAKLSVANGKSTRLELLGDVSKSSEIAANALSALSSADAGVEQTMKFINQTGDFARYLETRLQSGEDFSAEEKESVKKIHEMLKKLSDELKKVKDNISEGYLFINSEDGNNIVLSDIFTGLNDPSVEYPQLIYDGPFSDALIDKEAKGISGEEIDETRAREIAASLFGDAIQNLSFDGEWGGDIETLNFSCTLSGAETTLQFAKKGGMLLSVSGNRNVDEQKLDVEECVNKASDFLKKCGFNDMGDVWTANDNNVVYVNFAPVANSVVVYPDLIKVKVAADTGDVLGMDALNYAFNHTSREIPSPAISAEQAKNSLSSPDARGGTLCLIPYKTNAEKLAYEFILDADGTYYIYVDALTGEEINVLYVISTTGGMKLI